MAKPTRRLVRNNDGDSVEVIKDNGSTGRSVQERRTSIDRSNDIKRSRYKVVRQAGPILVEVEKKKEPSVWVKLRFRYETLLALFRPPEISEALLQPMKEWVFGQVNYDSPAAQIKTKLHPVNGVICGLIVNAAILVNAVSMGLEVDHGRGESIIERPAFFAAELIFSGIFFAEMLLRLQCDGKAYFESNWNIIDFLLIAMSFVDIWFTIVSSAGSDFPDMKVMSAFRVLRLLKIIRALRLLRRFSLMWMLLRGFVQCLSTIFSVLFCLMILCYVGAIFARMLLGSSEWWIDTVPETEVYFGSILGSMLTLFQIITQDSWGPIVWKYGYNSWPWFLFFILIMMFGAYSILNIIIGVITEKILSVSLEMEDEVAIEIRDLEKKLLRIATEQFMLYDEDGSGEVDRREFGKAKTDPIFGKIVSQLTGQEISDFEAVEEVIFSEDALGIPHGPPNRGTVTGEKLMEIILRYKGTASSIDMVQTLIIVERAQKKLFELHQRLDKLMDSIDTLNERLDDLWGLTGDAIKSEEDKKKRDVIIQDRSVRRKGLMNYLDRQQLSVGQSVDISLEKKWKNDAKHLEYLKMREELGKTQVKKLLEQAAKWLPDNLS